MSTAFVRGISRNFDSALRLMDAAFSDCPASLWEKDLWPVDASANRPPDGALHCSATWFLGYHALTCLDYDLGAGFEPWEPPKPFDENTFASPNRVFTKAELLGYLDFCRDRAQQSCAALTEETAARLISPTHRYAGTPYGEIVTAIPLHVVEHAAQIRQFLTHAGIEVRPMPGDRAYRDDQQ